MLTSSEIRQRYLNFFKARGHEIRPSASLIPVNDPTLLWINSGVATLKKYFDGSETPKNPRMTNSQKSIRTNDIENVGRTARHHTLFEMLGNFSIGDYFKKDVIPWAYEFLTSEEGLNFEPEKLYITYYPEDQETFDIWTKDVGFPAERLIPTDDNFWDIGAGPCGPCTEIFYDRGEEHSDLAPDDPENYPSGENERWLEIWNLVFSEFNHMPDDTYQPLPHKNVDTGMGLERVVSVIQNTETNFETDLFMPIIESIQKLTTVRYGDSPVTDVSFKVIADHIRAVSFAIGDGALPSNEGRGYIIRRLIRRSVMHGNKLGINHVFLKSIVSVVEQIMGGFYPEIVENRSFIEQVIETEEIRFHETLTEGLALLNQHIEQVKQDNANEIDGKAAFTLYDTYGFPLELTLEYASEAGLKVDEAGFEREMEAQKERARSARHTDDSMKVQDGILRDIKVASEFVGYDFVSNISKVQVILNQGEIIETADASLNKVEVIFEQTPFYAEQGGQVADTGYIYKNGEKIGRVIDVKKAPNGQPIHIVELQSLMQTGEEYDLAIDVDRRQLIKRNHTATHLLHRALKDVLGKHANQAGSLVNEFGLRFDFSHFGQVTIEELKRMEEIVNERIWASLNVNTAEMSLDNAKELGAMALFGEKYGDVVRVVNIAGYSNELCGGTHVANTSEIGLFKIKSESGIGAGVRRIEAVTSKEAFKYLSERLTILDQASHLVKAQKVVELPERIEQLQAEHKALTSKYESLVAKQINQAAAELFNQVEEINGVRFIALKRNEGSMQDLMQLADEWRNQKSSDILVLGLQVEDKANLIVAVSDEKVSAGLSANKMIKAISKAIQGGGGGKDRLSQAGGKNPAGITEAFDLARQYLSENA